MEKTEYSIFSMGDVLIDHITYLNGELNSLEKLNRNYRTSILTNIGGMPLFSIHAKKSGFSKVYFCGIVGRDCWGDFINKTLTREGVIPLLSVDNRNTGNAIIIYSSENNRLMITDLGANTNRKLGDVQSKILKTVDIIHLAGYDLTRDSTKELFEYVIENASKLNKFISFDLVPHKIFQYASAPEVIKYTKKVNIITLELETAIKLLNIDLKFNKFELIKDVIGELFKIYEMFILRVNNDVQIITNRQGCIIEKTYYSKQKDKTGYLDKLLADFLYKFLISKRSLKEYFERFKNTNNATFFKNFNEIDKGTLDIYSLKQLT